MEPEDLPRAPRRGVDLAAWSLVGVATVATIGSALAQATGIAPVPLYAVSGSAGLLVLSAAITAARHIRASRAAHACKDAYDVAFASEVGARERLSFARHAAALMATLPQGEGLRAVLQESLERFGAEAAAVVGDDITIVTSETVERPVAQAGVLHVALETVRAGRAVAQQLTDDGANALTIPLRIGGALTNVMVLWRRGDGFGPDDLDGLSLVARIVELSMENFSLVEEVREQLTGTLRMMIDLVEQRLPNYSAHSERVARFAVAVGRHLGVAEADLEELRVAGLLHDVGMLSVPETILNTPRRLTLEEQVELRGHPEHGAALTRVANLSLRVQDAIMSHHERVDGMGYPRGLRGDDIPLSARILNVCDAFVALVSDRPHRPRQTPEQALDTLRASAGTHYDERVVAAFAEVCDSVIAAESTPDAAPAAPSLQAVLAG